MGSITMAILVNQCPNKPKVNIGRDGIMSEQVRFLNKDPHFFLPFDHEVKAKHRREIISTVVHSLIAMGALALLIGWVML
jgi:hypothetical protein